LPAPHQLDRRPGAGAIHWDIVKDLRAGGGIELDGRLVQKDGVWTEPQLPTVSQIWDL
jgi:hypothetical protein